MANQLANQLIRRLAQSSAVSLRCGCSTAAGPSVIRQAHSARRALHVLGRTQQETTQMQRPSTKERSTERVSGTTHPKSTVNASTSAASLSTSHPQSPQSSSVTSAPSQVSEVQGSEGTVEAANEAAPAKRPSFSFARPKQHPKKQGNLVCTLHFSSYTDQVDNLQFFTQFCVHAAYAFGLPCSLPAFLPTKSSLRTVPRSPFVHKPSQENFVKKEHSRQIKIYDSDLGAVGQFIDHISENSMSGVRLKATMWENKPVGYGQKMVNDAQDLELTEAQKVRQMAESLLAAGFGEGADKQASESDAKDGQAEGAPEQDGEATTKKQES